MTVQHLEAFELEDAGHRFRSDIQSVDLELLQLLAHPLGIEILGGDVRQYLLHVYQSTVRHYIKQMN